MSRIRLLLRTFWYFRFPNLATVLGIAAGTAVFAGSLIVGDSVRNSLGRIVNDRLGDVDHVLVCPHFFRQSLADRLSKLDSFTRDFARAEALIATTGNCTEMEKGTKAPRVSVFGRGDIEPGACVLSEPLSEALGAGEGKTIIVRMAPAGRSPLEIPFDRRGDDIASLRLRVARVAKKTEMEGSFSFYVSQRPARNVWVSLDELQGLLGSEGAANVLFVAAKKGHTKKADADALQAMVKEAASLEDYGLRLVDVVEGGVAIESEWIFLNEEVEQAARKVPGSSVEVLAYLANTIKDARNGREFPYSMVAGISALPDGPVGEGEIVLNQWAADDLKAKLGDEIQLFYFARGPNGPLEERCARFKLSRIIETKGIGADKTLVPPFKGVTDAEKMGQWDPPPDFEFHAERIRAIDEEYWVRFRAAPKALINIKDARKLWETRFGGLTSLRFSNIPKTKLANDLLRDISPASMGLMFRPIRSEQLLAASGNTDFAGLFTGFSFFLITSAALLVILLLRLSVEQRSRQIGIMLAQGFTERAVRRLLLGEGIILLAVGAAVGIAAAVVYAWLMMAGLRTLWRDAVGTTLLTLHLGAGTLAGGFASGLLIGAFAIWRGISYFRKIRIAEIVAGRKIADDGRFLIGRKAMFLAGILFLTALSLVCVAGVSDKISTPVAFFIAGACLLVALLLGLRTAMAWARETRKRRYRPLAIFGFGIRNAARHPTRSMLTVSIMASAYFILFAVGSMKGGESAVSLDKHGSAGGYAMIAEFDVPIPYRLDDEKSRRYVGVRSADEDLWDRIEIIQMRANAGEDVSCRNLYRPSTPRVLSVPDELIEQGGFSFVSSLRKTDNPWKLLNDDSDGGVPVILDAETAQWILHKNLGETIPIVDEGGRTRGLRIAALLRTSIFQGEVLMGERNFLSVFPSASGYQTLLIRTSPQDAEAVKKILLRDLSDFGATVETTSERLASFFSIANSYISAFEMLGGLGVLLGSFGLVVVLVRGVIERRSEFALMSALGFRRRSVVFLVLSENGFLLVSGVFVGVFSAILATSPQLWKNNTAMNLLPMTTVFCTIILSFALFIVTSSLIIHRITPTSLRHE